MSTYEKFDIIFSGFGLLISVVGFYFIWQQIKQISSTIKSSTNNNLYSLTIDINKFLIEHPNLRSYFYGDQNGQILKYDSTHPQFQEIETLADIYITFWEYIFEEKDNLGLDLFETWESWKKDIYSKSQAIQNHLSSSKHWYKAEFLKSFE